MVKLKCDQCDKTFTKPTKLQAAAALRMHVGRKHSGAIPTAKPFTRQNRVASNGTADHSMALATTTEQVKPDRRTKAWRQANPDLAAPLGGRGRRRTQLIEISEHRHRVCYCPRCGLNIQALEMAIPVAEKMSPA